jgi:mannose-6-phosphate isomerase-like protein (cupin superfamily)
MNRRFTTEDYFRIPDGTLLSPFLNPKDSNSALPFDLFDGFSIAAGRVEPKTQSKIHMLPHVAQVTFVRRGAVTTVIREAGEDVSYEIELEENEAVLTRPGAFFQLRNERSQPCEVLYIVSPAYLYEEDDSGNVLYDDSVILEEGWTELEQIGWAPPKPPSSSYSATARQAAAQRLRLKKAKSAT